MYVGTSDSNGILNKTKVSFHFAFKMNTVLVNLKINVWKKLKKNELTL